MNDITVVINANRLLIKTTSKIFYTMFDASNFSFHCSYFTYLILRVLNNETEHTALFRYTQIMCKLRSKIFRKYYLSLDY